MLDYLTYASCRNIMCSTLFWCGHNPFTHLTLILSLTEQLRAPWKGHIVGRIGISHIISFDTDRKATEDKVFALHNRFACTYRLCYLPHQFCMNSPTLVCSVFHDPTQIPLIVALCRHNYDGGMLSAHCHDLTCPQIGCWKGCASYKHKHESSSI